MDDRTRYFDRPTREETAADRKARKRQEDQEAHEKRVRERHEAEQARIREEARQANPKGMWWPGS